MKSTLYPFTCTAISKGQFTGYIDTTNWLELSAIVAIEDEGVTSKIILTTGQEYAVKLRASDVANIIETHLADGKYSVRNGHTCREELLPKGPLAIADALAITNGLQ